MYLLEKLRELLTEMREQNHSLNHRPLELSLNRLEQVIDTIDEEYFEAEKEAKDV